MKLGEWLTSKGMTNAAFAELIGVDESSVSRYVNGRLPRRGILPKIKTATDGQVTANDFVAEDADDVDENRPVQSAA